MEPAENMQPHSRACMPAPLVGLPLPVTKSTAKIPTIITSMGISIFQALGFALLATSTATLVLSSTLEAGSSSSPVASTRCSAFFIAPKSTGRKQDARAKNTAIMQ